MYLTFTFIHFKICFVNLKTYKFIKSFIVVLVAVAVAISVFLGNILLAFLGVITGMLLLTLIKKKTQVKIEDERTEQISLRACKATYFVITCVLLISSFLLITLGYGSRIEATFIISLGIVLANVTMFIISLYSFFFYYFSKKL